MLREPLLWNSWQIKQPRRSYLSPQQLWACNHGWPLRAAQDLLIAFVAGYVFHVGVTEGAERDIEYLWLLTISKNLASYIAKSNIVLKDTSRVWKRFSAVVRPPLTLGDAMCLSFNRCCQEAAISLASTIFHWLVKLPLGLRWESVLGSGIVGNRTESQGKIVRVINLYPNSKGLLGRTLHCSFTLHTEENTLKQPIHICGLYRLEFQWARHLFLL